jgi:hypothetical protein
MDFISILFTAFLFGGMLLFSVGFGTLAFKFLETPIARQFIRKTFPFFYFYVFSISAVASAILYFHNFDAFVLMLIIAITTIPNAFILMPAINFSADNKFKRRFIVLHGFSVCITLTHIILAASVLYYLS